MENVSLVNRHRAAISRIIKVTHEKPNTISVDDIRTQVNNDIVIKPYSKYKIYIIPEADLMSAQGTECIA